MNESPLFTRTYDMLLWLLPRAAKFPRQHRFGLGERVVRRALDFQELLLAAAARKGPPRRDLLLQADAALGQLKALIRLSRDLELLSIGQYEYVLRLLVEVGRLLGAWIKQTA